MLVNVEEALWGKKMGSVRALSQSKLLALNRFPACTYIRCCSRAAECIKGERSFSTSSPSHNFDGSKQSHKFVFVGGGAGGLSVASYFARKFPNQVAIVEPSDVSR